MVKRLFDIVLSVVGLIATGPVLVLSMLAIWLQDRRSPFYVAPRVGKGGKVFKMVKLRSMTVNADRSGIDSTSASDLRITSVGKFIRAYKLDELSQLWNVLKGDMSFVGPRPNVQRETDIYTPVERRLLSIRPGITDIASIVFSDENEILRDSEDPDIDYNQLIRPWKSRLGLLYVDNRSLFLDIRLIFLTAIAVISRERALEGMQKVLDSLGYNNIEVHLAKETLGWPEEAPYDAIIATAGAPQVPPDLVAQLAIGGRMIIPVGSRYVQELVKITRLKSKNTIQNLGGCCFVSLIGKGAWEEAPKNYF